MSGTPSFVTFWAGKTVSAFESACFLSYVKRGYSITVYTYDTIENLPPSVPTADAAEIVDKKFLNSFLIKDKPSLSHFSDLFRYELFSRTDHIWVDSDMYLLRKLEFELPKNLLAREDDTHLCGAIMRLDRNDPALPELVARTQAVSGRNLKWGETGPRLLTDVFGPKIIANSYGPEQFFPVYHRDFWKVLLPEYRQECEALCNKSYSLHLWNNIVTQVGVWKDVMPPKDSYLSNVFTEDGMSDLFANHFPVESMRHMVDNYRMRISGSLGDLRKMARVVAPNVRRRAARHLHEIWQRFIPS